MDGHGISSRLSLAPSPWLLLLAVAAVPCSTGPFGTAKGKASSSDSPSSGPASFLLVLTATWRGWGWRWAWDILQTVLLGPLGSLRDRLRYLSHCLCFGG